MNDIDEIAKALRKAYRLCETQNQRRGVERAAGTISDMLANRYPGFGRVPFMSAVKDGE